ncbi:ThiF family adenylyltransferase [Candidatus Saccharibacteria bacterium]|nr:MAG: ThiF family adenylyltransferase [Candidatus Saccharibacteria bacterium]
MSSSPAFEASNLCEAFRHLDTVRKDPDDWQPPQIFKLDSPVEEIRFEALLRAGKVTGFRAQTEPLANDLFTYLYPADKKNQDMRREFHQSVIEQGQTFGSYVFFPWSGEIVLYLDEEDHRGVRNYRDRDLRTRDQQRTLREKTIACIGLSVGSKAARSMVQSGIGNHYVIGDGDTLDSSNLNRIDGTVRDVGASKVAILARHISEVDPWIKQTHLPDGFHAGDERVLLKAGVDIIVEAVDDMSAKALLRLFAERRRIPLIMPADLHDKSMIDVERHDLRDKKRKLPFMGRISRADTIRISEFPISEAEKESLMLAHTGATNLSVRMMQSVMSRDAHLGGMPQKGATATRGGADVEFAAAEILLGHDLPTGRYYDNPRDTFNLGPEHNLLTWIRTALAVKSYAESRRRANQSNG